MNVLFSVYTREGRRVHNEIRDLEQPIEKLVGPHAADVGTGHRHGNTVVATWSNSPTIGESRRFSVCEGGVRRSSTGERFAWSDLDDEPLAGFA